MKAKTPIPLIALTVLAGCTLHVGSDDPPPRPIQAEWRLDRADAVPQEPAMDKKAAMDK